MPSKKKKIIEISVLSTSKPNRSKLKNQNHSNHHSRLPITNVSEKHNLVERLNQTTKDLSNSNNFRQAYSTKSVKTVVNKNPTPYPENHETKLNNWSNETVTKKRSGETKNTQKSCLKLVNKDRVQGLLVGLATMSIVMTIILAVVLTRKSTEEVSPCESLSWSTAFTIAAGNGTYGSASNQLKEVADIFIDENDAQYILDAGNYRVQKYLANSMNGITVAGVTGVSGANESLLRSPQSIYVDLKKNIYIGDIGPSRILVWPEGASSGTVLPGSTLFVYVYDIEGDSSGNIYALSYTSGQIVMWTSSATNYTVVTTGSTLGYSASQLLYPRAFTMDAVDEILYIVNSIMHTIVAWPFYATSGYIIAGQNLTVGSANSLLNTPSDIKRDSNGNLYVVDSSNHRIVLFCQNPPSTNGTPIININIFNPMYIALDSKLNIYVYELNSYRIKKFARIT